MKKIIALLLITLSFCTTAQEKLNNYKYVLIPAKYDFQKTENENNVNLLLKYKFQQMGFETYLDTDKLPHEIKTNSCTYLKPLVITKNTVFKTILHIQVINCDNDVLFETREGSSRTKSDKISYNEAIRMALSSFGDYRLKYEKNDKLSHQIQPKTIIELQAEINALKAEKNLVNEELKKVKIETPVVNEVVPVDEKSYLLARSTKFGYILVNSVSEKEEFEIYTTNLAGVFLLKNKSGFIYKKEGVWVYEYIKNNQIVLTYLDVKFN